MKKIWLVGIGKNFDLGNGAKPHKLHNYFEPVSTVPLMGIGECAEIENSIELFKYMPDNFTDSIKGFKTYHLEYTDNIEKVRKAWFVGTISNYRHLKNLEHFGLLKIDKRTERPMKRIFREAEEHRLEYPELWV